MMDNDYQKMILGHKRGPRMINVSQNYIIICNSSVIQCYIEQSVKISIHTCTPIKWDMSMHAYTMGFILSLFSMKSQIKLSVKNKGQMSDGFGMRNP